MGSTYGKWNIIFDKFQVLRPGLSGLQKYEKKELRTKMSKKKKKKKIDEKGSPWALFPYLEIQFNPLEKIQVCRLGIAGKGRY